MNYYTLQIDYGGTPEKPLIEEFKDLHCEEGANETLWKKQLRERLYTTGFTIQTAPGAWEFINPFRIRTAFLLKQNGKIGV